MKLFNKRNEVKNAMANTTLNVEDMNRRIEERKMFDDMNKNLEDCLNIINGIEERKEAIYKIKVGE